MTPLCTSSSFWWNVDAGILSLFGATWIVASGMRMLQSHCFSLPGRRGSSAIYSVSESFRSSSVSLLVFLPYYWNPPDHGTLLSVISLLRRSVLLEQRIVFSNIVVQLVAVEADVSHDSGLVCEVDFRIVKRWGWHVWLSQISDNHIPLQEDFQTLGQVIHVIYHLTWAVLKYCQILTLLSVIDCRFEEFVRHSCNWCRCWWV